MSSLFRYRTLHAGGMAEGRVPGAGVGPPGVST
jgi:hypothetical protein